MWIDKAETWALADELGVLELVRTETLTCYNGVQGDGCGHCPACTLRREGLEKYPDIEEIIMVCFSERVEKAYKKADNY